MLPWLPDSDVLTDITNWLLVSHVCSTLSCFPLFYLTNLHDLLSLLNMCGSRVVVNGGPGHPPVKVTVKVSHPPAPPYHHNWAYILTPLGTKQPRWEGGRWGKVGGMVRGGMEGQRWRCRSGWTECGGMVAQRVVLQPRKEKKKKENNNRKHGIHRRY